MVTSFETQTRKPTGSELKNITVDSLGCAELLLKCSSLGDWIETSTPVGEWLVDVLCLIPIHVAITKENRFVPLKDGVSSPELEKSLLGAEVGAIIDALSLGWYESIFQSYLSQKVRLPIQLYATILLIITLLACQSCFLNGFVKILFHRQAPNSLPCRRAISW